MFVRALWLSRGECRETSPARRAISSVPHLGSSRLARFQLDWTLSRASWHRWLEQGIIFPHDEAPGALTWGDDPRQIRRPPRDTSYYVFRLARSGNRRRLLVLAPNQPIFNAFV
jgi:hypothetical protein